MNQRFHIDGDANIQQGNYNKMMISEKKSRKWFWTMIVTAIVGGLATLGVAFFKKKLNLP